MLLWRAKRTPVEHLEMLKKTQSDIVERLYRKSQDNIVELSRLQEGSKKLKEVLNEEMNSLYGMDLSQYRKNIIRKDLQTINDRAQQKLLSRSQSVLLSLSNRHEDLVNGCIASIVLDELINERSNVITNDCKNNRSRGILWYCLNNYGLEKRQTGGFLKSYASRLASAANSARSNTSAANRTRSNTSAANRTRSNTSAANSARSNASASPSSHVSHLYVDVDSIMKDLSCIGKHKEFENKKTNLNPSENCVLRKIPIIVRSFHGNEKVDLKAIKKKIDEHLKSC
jgi:hypothetical protein